METRSAQAMTTYFAYGANLSRTHMSRACPNSICIGQAVLMNHRFVINRDGWATVVPTEGECVHGVLWLLSAECECNLDGQEDVAGGLYGKASLGVVTPDGAGIEAMAYVARTGEPGLPNPGYLESIMTWAGVWEFPSEYRSHLSKHRCQGYPSVDVMTR